MESTRLTKNYWRVHNAQHFGVWSEGGEGADAKFRVEFGGTGLKLEVDMDRTGSG